MFSKRTEVNGLAWVVIWDLIETAHSSIGRAEDCSIVCSSSLGHVFKSHWADIVFPNS